MLHPVGYKFALRITGAQRKHFTKEFGASRFIFNKLLERHKQEYALFKEGKCERPSFSSFSFANKIIHLRNEFPFLKEVSRKTLSSSTDNLSKSLTNHIVHKYGQPKFKSRKHRQSITYYDFNALFRFITINVNGKDIVYLKVPKLKEPIKVLWHRDLPSDPSSVTISRDTLGNFYASFLCRREGILTNGNKITGLDLGLKDIVTDSEGISLKSPRFYRCDEKKIKRQQRKLSRKKKGSKNRYKQLRKFIKLHKKVASRRDEYLHKLSRTLVRDNQAIGIESLNIAGIQRALKLGKSVSDTGLGTLLKYIIYKADESQHCKVILYPMLFPSTQVCHCCFHRLTRDSKLKLKDRKWQCPKCLTKHDRDINAAKVIKEGAVRILQLLPKELKNKHGVIATDLGLEFETLFPESLAT